MIAGPDPVASKYMRHPGRSRKPRFVPGTVTDWARVGVDCMTNDVVNAVADAKSTSLRSNMATPSRRDALKGGRAIQKLPNILATAGCPADSSGQYYTDRR